MTGQDVISACADAMRGGLGRMYPILIAQGHHPCKTGDGASWGDGKKLEGEIFSEPGPRGKTFDYCSLCPQIWKVAGFE